MTDSRTVCLLNPDTTAVVYTSQGHSLEPGKRVEVDELDDVGARAVAAGFLVVVAAPDRGTTPTGGSGAESTEDATVSGAAQEVDGEEQTGQQPRSATRKPSTSRSVDTG